jgi:uncharacterized protein YndB with AHSA1/START domain
MNAKIGHEKLGGVSSDAVAKATGKIWPEWIALLDKEGAKDLSHKDIARLLYEKKYITSGWWCQMVTVGYEQARGKRIIGETATTGFEIGVRKTMPITAQKAWELVTSEKGLSMILGEVKDIKLEPGYSYKAKNGTKGEIRTLKKGIRLRLTWQPKGWAKTSTLQVYVEDKGEKSSIGFHQEQLRDEKMREKMRIHWQKVLQQLAK